MNKIVKITEENQDATIKIADKVLKENGNFILIPTETVYGLACLSTDELAKKRIYESKKRPENKPFQLLVSSLDMLRQNTDAEINTLTEKIVQEFCPGAITVVIPTKNSDIIKIGFRIPDYDFILKLINALGEPISATSANITGEPPALNIDNALKTLNLMPSLIIDGGQIDKYSKASTVVEVIGNSLKIIREGGITPDEIKKRIKY